MASAAAALGGWLDAAQLALMSPLALAAALAVGLLVAKAGAPIAATLVFAVGCAVAGWLPLSPMVAGVLPPSALILLGALLAWGAAMTRWVPVVAGVAGGIAAGLASGALTATPGEAAIAAVALSIVLLIASLLRGLLRRPGPVFTMAPRVIGIWIAAIGALLLALALRRAGG